MKNKKINLFIKLTVPIISFAVIGGALIYATTMNPSMPRTVVINADTEQKTEKDESNFEIIKKEIIENPKNTSYYSGFLDNDNIFFYKKPEKIAPSDTSTNTSVSYDGADSLYTYNLATLKEERISEDDDPKKFASLIYINNNKIYFGEEHYELNKEKDEFDGVDEYYSYDITTKERTKLEKDTFVSNLRMGRFSEDKKYYVDQVLNKNDSDPLKLSFYDIENQKKQIINTNLKNFKTAHEYYNYGKYIYLAGEKITNAFNLIGQYKEVLYKIDINNPNNITEIFSWPTVTARDENSFYNTFTTIQNITFLDSKRILFQGGYKKDTGIFIYNLDSKKLYKISSDIMLPSDSIMYDRYSISADKTKIAYLKYETIDGKKEFNTYVARISDNKLVQSTQVLENCNYWWSCWSPDSKKLLIPENLDVEHGWNIRGDKIKLHLITFK